jgi:hypothetical protein
MGVLHTPRLVLPYPDGNDLLRDGDDRIHDLASALDEIVATVDQLEAIELTPGPPGADGPPGPPGASNAVYTATWSWTTKTADANTAGQIGLNATSWAATTQININQQKADNADVAVYLARIEVGGQLYLQMKTDSTRHAYYDVTGTPVDHGNWWSVPVTFASGAGAIPGGTTLTALSILVEGATGLPARTTTTYTTASLAPSGTENGTVSLANGYRLLSIQTSRPARVRVYSTTGKRTTDAGRPIGTDPTGDHGCLLEFVTATGLMGADLTPTVDGFDGAATPTGAIPIAVTNLDTVTGTVTATFAWIRTE